jgi:predicted CoA-binding protein
VSDIDAALRRILGNYECVAVVGLSTDPSKASNRVAKYLLDKGFDVIPVNPNYDEVLGRTCYPDLHAIPTPVEIVNVFQRSERVPPFVDAAIDIGARVVWMQLDIVHDESAEKARAAGLEVVMNRCIKIEYARLFDGPDAAGANTGAI